jgi:NADP-dependent aldehyde dehydrogenase
LRGLAQGLESARDPIAARAQSETGLPAARLQSEMGRTCGQLRLFADLVEEGSWVDARIDTADPARRPLPKPDVRSMRRALGPVAVFGASNFPLAFSVAGGDTASALAAGNPVIVKAHPLHPGTSELVGQVVAAAVRRQALPEGTFSLLFDDGFGVARALVQHPLVQAVGFTGSRAGGEALTRLAAARPQPIPVFAEMGSVNPVLVLPGALRARARAIAEGLHASFTLGVGQFCTNPGVVLLEAGADGDAFVEQLAELTRSTPAGPMLSPKTSSAYAQGLERLRARGAAALARGRQGEQAAWGQAALWQIDAASALAQPELTQEVFGPSTLVIRYANAAQLEHLVRSLEGSLTATVHALPDELLAQAPLLSLLARKAGRLVFNQFPTGVEVNQAMVHGGPFPATSDGRSTSVGTRAIERFSRLIAYQNFPHDALPAELRDANPRGIWRLLDGFRTRELVRTADR